MRVYSFMRMRIVYKVLCACVSICIFGCLSISLRASSLCIVVVVVVFRLIAVDAEV